jgi:hypothetical protein
MKNFLGRRNANKESTFIFISLFQYKNFYSSMKYKDDK